MPRKTKVAKETDEQRYYRYMNENRLGEADRLYDKVWPGQRAAAAASSSYSEQTPNYPSTEGQGGHPGALRGFGPTDIHDQHAYIQKGTVPTEADFTETARTQQPDWERVSTGFMTQEQAFARGATERSDGKPQTFQNNTMYGMGSTDPTNYQTEQASILDTKLAFPTALKSAVQTADPGRSGLSADWKVAKMMFVDFTSMTALKGARTVNGSKLEKGRAALGRTDPIKNLYRWAKKNNIDSRAIYAQGDAMNQWIAAANKKENYTFVAGSKFDVVGRLDGSGTMASITVPIDFAYPTDDPKFRQNYIRDLTKHQTGVYGVAERLRQEERENGTARTSPVLTNNRYDDQFRPGHPTLRGMEALRAAGKNVESVQDVLDSNSSPSSSERPSSTERSSVESMGQQFDSLSFARGSTPEFDYGPTPSMQGNTVANTGYSVATSVPDSRYPTQGGYNTMPISSPQPTILDHYDSYYGPRASSHNPVSSYTGGPASGYVAPAPTTASMAAEAARWQSRQAPGQYGAGSGQRRSSGSASP